MDEELPAGIGPHEGRELELMLAGEKPLAMFNDDLPTDMEPPEIAFDPYVAEGRFVKAEIAFSCSIPNLPLLRYYFYALPGEEWRIARLIELERRIFEHRLPTTRELETEIGRLLGYDDADILVFLDHFFSGKT